MDRKIRSYKELIGFETFEERFEYLKLNGSVGEDTFGFLRFRNQAFYRSTEWRNLRNHIIVRDHGCDLGILGRDIFGRVYIHHMNPIMLEDLDTRYDLLLNPRYLITTTHETHNAIHYGDKNLLILEPTNRTKHDTTPWRKKKEEL